MVDIPKVSRTDGVKQTTRDNASSDWGNVSFKKSSAPTQQKLTSVKFNRAPQTLTNQDASLSPEQMAKLLSQQETRRKAQDTALRRRPKKGRKNLDGSLDGIENIFDDDLDEDLGSLFEGTSPEQMQQFLAFFREEMQRHLNGMEFGEVIYDPEMIREIMEKYFI